MMRRILNSILLLALILISRESSSASQEANACITMNACFSVCNITVSNSTNNLTTLNYLGYNCTERGARCYDCCIASKCIENENNLKTSLETQKNPKNLLANLDSRLVNILTTVLPSYNYSLIIDIVSNQTGLVNFFKELDFSHNCKAGQLYYDFIQDQLVSNASANQWINFDILKNTLACKQDCNFKKLLSVANTAFTNKTEDEFAKFVVKYLPSNVKAKCRDSFKTLTDSLKNINASNLLNNLENLSLLKAEQLSKFNSEDSLLIAKALTNLTNEKLNQLMAKTLAANIPATTDVIDVPSVASSVPLQCFQKSDILKLAQSVSSMDLDNMDSFRKGYLANKIAESKNSTAVIALLTSSTDPVLINSISTTFIKNLSIDVTHISVAQLPTAFLKEFAKMQLKNKSLADFIDLNALSKLLIGLTRTDILNIPVPSRLTTIVNILNASLSSHIPLTSYQRSVLLNSLFDSLQNITGSKNATLYLSNLTTAQLQVLYPLFIESSSSILSAFTKLNSFATVISKVATISSSDCCGYSRNSRQKFASYAVPFKFAYTNLGLDDLISLGPCIVSVLSIDYLNNISSVVFGSYFPTLGVSFQPDDSQIRIVQSLISKLAANASSQDTFVFSTLSDLALFYNFSSSYANSLTYWNSSGPSLLNIINSARNPNEPTVQICHLGLTNSNSIQNLIRNFGYNLITKFKASLSARRRKRVATSLTCNQLNSLSGSLNQLSAADLALINLNEFYICQTLLGLISNAWSTDQLTQLANLAKTYYKSTNNISDANIVQLNGILAGFMTSDLELLNFSSTSSISALGSVNNWSPAQLTSLNVPLTKYIKNYLNGTITASFVSLIGNLACSLSSVQISSISKANFSSLVASSLSKISLFCPNIADWYNLARNSSDYGASLYTSPSALTELGAIISGINAFDFKQISSDSIVSITSLAWKFMPGTIVNQLSSDQMASLTLSQLAALSNSPNYASFTPAIKTDLSSLATGTSNVYSKSHIVLPNQIYLVSIISILIMIF